MAKANVTNTYVVPAGTKLSPYYDDFNEDNNFHRILFRPGRAVQARELTQIQTILQNQVERFGRHIFENGSPVIGGDIYLPDSGFTVISIDKQFAGSTLDPEYFVNKTIISNTAAIGANVKFRVTATEEFTDVIDLHGTFLTDRGVQANDVIRIEGDTVYANVSQTGNFSRLAFLRDSVFFYNGYFVKVPAQSVVLSNGNQLESCKVGLELHESFVTESTDSSLLDPAQESSNYQAPGAARYQIDLVLAKREISSADDEKFIELAKINNGVVINQIKFPVYSEIEEVLARRTYDESGNYTVRPFVLDVRETADANVLSAVLSPGKAYIYGFEYETIAETYMLLPKARTTKSISGYNLNMNYGNYVIVDNLTGSFDLNTMGTFDIHCVPKDFVQHTSNAAYQTTKIGTGRIRELEFYGGDVDVAARKYEFYLFDTNYRAISGNANTVTSNTVTFYDTTLLTSNTDAYKNATLRIVSGNGAGYSYSISSYDGSTKTLTTATDFAEIPNANTVLSIEFDFTDAESFVQDKRYTPGATANSNTNITTLNKIDGTANGDAYVSEPSRNSLLFSLPDQYIASGISNTSYMYRKAYTGIQFSAGQSASFSAGLTEQFLGTTVSSNTASSAMDNFFVVVTDKQTSARNNGDVVKVSTTIDSSNPLLPESATCNTGNTTAADSFIATVYTKMEYDINGVAAKTKTFVQSNTSTISFAAPANVSSTLTPTGSSANVYINAGQVVIHNPSRKVGIPESIYISDVIGIDKIYDLNGAAVPTDGTPLSDFTNVTDRYDFDNGQRETHYDHASIKLKPGYRACKGPLVVCCYYYSHAAAAGTGGYFTVDSYPSLNTPIINNGVNIGDGYSIIPMISRTNGDVVNLTDCIDFRPVRQNITVSNPYASPNYTITGQQVPLVVTDFTVDYSYYLGRKDLVVLTDKRALQIVNGIPAKAPLEPSVPSRCMVLYSMTIPPYTEYPKDVRVKYIDNRRYTMRDIGKIDKRVENLEYYVSLNILEKKAVDMTITDVNGLNRTKYGIFADSFTGHSLGNSDLEDYQCAMQFGEGYLQCRANTRGVALSLNNDSSNNIKVHRDKITLNYSEVPFLSQPNASKFAPVAEYLYGTFRGNIITLPEADIWKDTNYDPDIIITDQNTVEHTSVAVFSSQVDSQSRSGAQMQTGLADTTTIETL